MQDEQFDGFEEDPLPSDGEPDFESDPEADEPHAAATPPDDFSDEPISEPEETAHTADAAADDEFKQHDDAAADEAQEQQHSHQQAASPEPQVGCSILLESSPPLFTSAATVSQHCMCLARLASSHASDAPPRHPAQVHPPEAAGPEDSPAARDAKTSLPADQADQRALRAASADMADPMAAHPQAVRIDMQSAGPHAEEQLIDTHTDAPVLAGDQAAEQLGGPPALHRGGMGGTGSEWIACDECGKWRQAAVGDVARGPWICANNTDLRCHHKQSQHVQGACTARQ